MQTCIWPSWGHCHSLSLVSVKSRLVLQFLLFWYRLTRVVPDKGSLNGCVCVCIYIYCLKAKSLIWERTKAGCGAVVECRSWRVQWRERWMQWAVCEWREWDNSKSSVSVCRRTRHAVQRWCLQSPTTAPGSTDYYYYYYCCYPLIIFMFSPGCLVSLYLETSCGSPEKHASWSDSHWQQSPTRQSIEMHRRCQRT